MITLPWPPTVNHYYTVSRGRKILSDRGRIYKRSCFVLMHNQGIEKMVGRFSVSIVARPPDNRKRDLDNILKPVLDALTEYGAIEDDSHIDDLRIQRFHPEKPGSIEILISSFSGGQ